MERDIIPMCIHHGMAVTPFNVVGGGKYTGRYKREDGENQRSRAGSVSAKDFEIMDTILALSKKYDRKPVQILINWTLQNEGISTVLMGARTV